MLRRTLISLLSLSLLTGLSAATGFAQNRKALARSNELIAQSDELFARGVDLYKAGRYAEAADLFTQSAEIDQEVIDPSSARFSYSFDWLASCYYKMGYEEDAQELNPYLYTAEPVDRRLTVRSDALSDKAAELFARGDYDGAERLLLQCGEIEQSVLGADHYFYAGTLCSLVDLYMSTDTEPARVEPVVRQALAIYEKNFGKDSPPYAATQLSLAKCRFAAQNYNDAVRLCEASLKVLEKMPDHEENWDYIAAMSDLAGYYMQTAQYAKAGDLYTRLVELTERVEGKESWDYIYALDGLSSYHYYNENYPDAIRFEKEAVSLAASMEDADEETVTELMSALQTYYAACALSLSDRQNFTEAIEMDSMALQVLDELDMKVCNDYIQILLHISQCRSNLEDYDGAIAAATQALEIFKAGDGLDDMSYVNALNYLSNYYGAKGDTIKAAGFAQAAAGYKESSGGFDEASLLNDRAIEQANKGNFEEAAALQSQAIESYRAQYGEDDMNVAIMLTNLADDYALISDYEQAIATQEQVLAIYEKYHLESSAEYAQALVSLSSYSAVSGQISGMYRTADKYAGILSGAEGRDSTAAYANTLVTAAYGNLMAGEFDRARQYLQAATDVVLKAKGSESFEYATILQAYSYLNAVTGDFLSSRMFAERALQIIAGSMGTDRVEYAEQLSAVGQSYAYEGNWEKAIEMDVQAIKLFERIGATKDMSYFNVLRNLAMICIITGPSFHAQALELQSKAVEVGQAIYGREHFLYLSSISDLALYHLFNGNYSEAKDYSVKAYEGYNRFVSSNFTDMTSGERGTLWNQINSTYTVMMPLMAYMMRDDDLYGYAYDATLMSKGFLLNSEIEISRLLLESGDEEAVAKYRELQRNRMRLNRLYETPVAERQADADSLSEIVRAQEVELVRLSKTYGNYTRNLSVSWKDVQSHLGKDDLAVEFLTFLYIDDQLNIRIMYAALTLDGDDFAPHMVPLFSPEDLEKIGKGDYYTTSVISDLVWKPLAQALQGKKNVYFSPAGELYNIAIESLPDYEGDGLISDRWNFYRLSSTRSLALERESVEPLRADIYGGLKYSAGAQTLVNDFVRHGGVRSADFGTVNADSLGLRGGVSDLPGTKVEADKIYRVVGTTGIAGTVYTDTLGTETSLKFLSGKRPNILHIATHGFYWTESEAQEKTKLNFLGAYNDNSSFMTQTEDKALTRTGLLFAGANYALSGRALPEGVDDGVLTAKEISVLDLRGLDLVVLSACQTGLGEVTGDGVFGLQRGFKKAGANSIVMSLWKVADNATQIFMAHFYYDLLCQKMTKRESFLDAQHYLRTTENGKYDKPEYWAAFILLDALD